MASDFVIRSGQSSVILSALLADPPKDYSYPTENSAPILAKEVLEIQPIQAVAGSIYGATSRFDIVRSTMLRDLYLQIDYNVGAGTALTAPPGDAFKEANVGANLIETIELRTRSRTICTLYQSYLRDYISTAPTSKSIGLARRAKMLDQTTGVMLSGAVTAGDTFSARSYCHIPGFFSEMVEANIDTGFVQQLQVVVRYAAQGQAGTIRPITGVVDKLWAWYWQPDLSYYNSLRSKNFGRATPLVQLIYDTMSEINVATSTTANSFDIKVSNPVFTTFVDIFNNTTAGNRARFAIDNYTVTFTSRAIQDSVPLLMGSWEQESMGSGALAIDSTDNIFRAAAQPLALHYGLSNDKTFCSGAVSYAQIDNPRIDVNTQTLTTAANYDVVFTHLFWSLLSTDGSNGSIIVSAST